MRNTSRKPEAYKDLRQRRKSCLCWRHRRRKQYVQPEAEAVLTGQKRNMNSDTIDEAARGGSSDLDLYASLALDCSAAQAFQLNKQASSFVAQTRSAKPASIYLCVCNSNKLQKRRQRGDESFGVNTAVHISLFCTAPLHQLFMKPGAHNTAQPRLQL